MGKSGCCSVLNVFEVNGPSFAIEVQRLSALFPRSKTRLLCASKRQLIFDAAGGQVHGDQTRFDRLDELVGLCEIIGDDRGGQSKTAAIGKQPCLLSILGGNHAQDRTENLLLSDAHVGPDSRKDRRLNEEPIFVNTSPQLAAAR